MYLLLYFRRLFNVACDLRVIYHILALWILVEKFLQNVKIQTQHNQWGYIVERYKPLKSQADCLNTVIGNNLGFYLVNTLFFFSVYINQIFRLNGTPLEYISAIATTIYIIETVALLFLACAISNKVGTKKYRNTFNSNNH